MANASMAEQLKALLQATGAKSADASQMMGTDPDSFLTPMNTTPQQPPVMAIQNDPVASPPQAQARPQPVGNKMQISPTGGYAPGEMQDIQRALREKIEQSEAEQGKNIDLQKALVAGQLGVKQGLDLSPAYATARMLGSKTAGVDYKAPEDVSKNDQAGVSALAKAQQALTDDQTGQLKTELQNKLLGNSIQNQRLGLMRDRLNEQVYGKVITGLRSDKLLTNALESNNSLNRTIDSMLAPGQTISMSSLHDLQQSTTGALTAFKGGGGVGERQDRYINTLQNSFQSLEQKFGNLDSVPKDDPTLVHFLSVAHEGQAVIEAQAKQRINVLSRGHENITELPTYKPMLQGVQDELSNSLKPAKYGASKSGAQSASAGAMISSDDQQAVDWAKANPTDMRAQKILRMHGM